MLNLYAQNSDNLMRLLSVCNQLKIHSTQRRAVDEFKINMKALYPKLDKE